MRANSLSIKSFKDETVADKIAICASAVVEELITVADTDTSTCPAVGNNDPPFAVTLIVPSLIGINTLYTLTPFASVVTDVAVSVSLPYENP